MFQRNKLRVTIGAVCAIADLSPHDRRYSEETEMWGMFLRVEDKKKRKIWSRNASSARLAVFLVSGGDIGEYHMSIAKIKYSEPTERCGEHRGTFGIICGAVLNLYHGQMYLISGEIVK